jgi:hypothetical protein
MSAGSYWGSGMRFCALCCASPLSLSTPTGSFRNTRTARGEYRTAISAAPRGRSRKQPMVTFGWGPNPGSCGLTEFDLFHGRRLVENPFEVRTFMPCWARLMVASGSAPLEMVFGSGPMEG